METTPSWSDAFYGTLLYAWSQVVAFLPRILSAIIVLIIGVLISVAISKIVAKIIEYFRVDTFLMRVGLKERLDRYNIRFTFRDFFAGIVRWFFYLVTFIAVAEVLQIPQLSQFINQIALYLPNVLIAVIILTVGFVLAQFVGDIIGGSLRLNQMTRVSAATLSFIARTAIIVFTIMAALIQLGIAPSLIQILFAGLVIALSLAAGLAFGLGGKDRAHDLLEGTRM